MVFVVFDDWVVVVVVIWMIVQVGLYLVNCWLLDLVEVLLNVGMFVGGGLLVLVFEFVDYLIDLWLYWVVVIIVEYGGMVIV